jgi:hypothetical protein
MRFRATLVRDPSSSPLQAPPVTRRPPQRRAASLLIAGGLATSLVGCGGGQPQQTPAPIAPHEVLRRGVDTSATLTAFTITLDTSVQARFRPGTVSTLVSDAVAQPLTITGQGRVDNEAASVDVDATISGLPSIGANVITVDRGIYIDMLGTTYRVDSPRALMPSRLPHALLAWLRSPTEVGRERVEGVPTIHLRGIADPASVVEALRSFAPALLPTTAVRRSVQKGVEATSIDVWIGLDDTRPYRIAGSLRYEGVPAFPSLRTATLTFDMRFSFQPDPASIRRPDTWQPLPLDRLRVLAGRE